MEPNEIDRGELRDAVRSMLAMESDSAKVRAAVELEHGFDPVLWEKFAELGWLGIDLPERHGGAGASFADLAVVLTELGRMVTPSPILGSGVLAAGALLIGGSDEQRAEWLDKMAAGVTIATVAMADVAGSVAEAGFRARREDAGWRIGGSSGFVPDAVVAHVIVGLAADDEDGRLAFLTRTDEAAVSITVDPVFDVTRQLCTVSIDGLVVADGDLLRGAEADSIFDALANRAAVALACDSLGLAERALEMTVDYLEQRVQFDRVLGSFQALKHRCANLLILVESSRALVEHAADAVAVDAGDANECASMAAHYACDAARTVVGEAVQLHGGIGFTWEHDLHLLLKRAKLNQALLGDSRWHRRRVADAAFGR